MGAGLGREGIAPRGRSRELRSMTDYSVIPPPVYEDPGALSSDVPMTDTLAPPTRGAADKRGALLAAALRLIARAGLHATPTAAVAREAGVAAGTLFLYFPSKEALVNALYLDLLAEQHAAAAADAPPEGAEGGDPREALWRSWHGLARWHLDHPEAFRVMQQCRTSGVLTAETREHEARAREGGLARFREAIAHGLLRDLPVTAFWALYAGPILALAESQEPVSDATLRATFDGVCRSVLPEA